MAEVLGLGLSHWPALLMNPRFWPNQLGATARVGLADPKRVQDPTTWPQPMQEEWGEDQGVAAAMRHAERLYAGFRTLYDRLTAFHPDLVVIFGDDQTENFLPDGVPPFSVFLGEEYGNRPFTNAGRLYGTEENIFGVSADAEYTIRGGPDAGHALIAELAADGFDLAYAYPCRSPKGLSHAFVNTTLALQGTWEDGVFPFPVLPMHVNCHGRRLFHTARTRTMAIPERPAPDAPSPGRCFALGQAVGRFFRESPWRVAIIGSSSWSHAFLTEKYGGIHPDLAADRRRLAELRDGRWRHWGDLTGAELEDAGEHEFRNWVAMAGAMEATGLTPEIVDFVESHLFASNKCFAYFV